jgi:hypothetical protein
MVLLQLPLASCSSRPEGEPPPPNPEPALDPGEEPEAGPEPDAQAAPARVDLGSLPLEERFENIAFRTMEEVEWGIGVPDEVQEDKDRVHWYYKVMAKGPGGDPAGHPDVQFIDGEVRFVVYSPLKSWMTTSPRPG